MKKTLLAISMLLLGVASAQEEHEHTATEKCGIHTKGAEVFIDHPEWKEQMEQDQEEFQEFYEEFAENWSSDDRSTYIIPVVVHVIHTSGVENISDEQIRDAIKQLNEDYSASNEDFVMTVAPFDAIAADMDIEFRLAGKDNEGNCTKGITRTYSTLTYGGGGGSVAALVEGAQGLWPQNKYMNVYVQADLGGPAGYTNYPSSWYPVDGMEGGIYMRSDYMGSIGSSNEYREHTLSHEAGHWLNLRHLWGNSNNPNEEDNCLTDDLVGDTPNTKGWTSCNVAGETCGSLDNVQNILEYSYCSTMFTEGQKVRVHAALNSSTAGRNNLWTPANLSATGVDGILCQADFSVDNQMVCSGSTVMFTDASYHQVTSRVWTFEGGTPSTSTDEFPMVTYDTPGHYNVTLQVFNGADEQTKTVTDFITVFEQSGAPIPYKQGFEGITTLNENNEFAVINENEGETWAVYTEDGHLSSQCAYLKNYGNDDGSYDDLISETIDLSSVDPSENVVLKFDYSYVKRSTSDKEMLKVYVSNDCGETWTLRAVLDSDDLTESTLAGPYFPLYDGWWKTEKITTITSPYFVENFMYKFEFKNNNGNNLFIDNINVYPASMTDIIESGDKTDFVLYPNPASNALFIQGEGVYSYELMDVTGRVIEQANYEGEISLSNYSPGVYHIAVSDNEGQFLGVRKFIKR